MSWDVYDRCMHADVAIKQMKNNAEMDLEWVTMGHDGWDFYVQKDLQLRVLRHFYFRLFALCFTCICMFCLRVLSSI